MKLFTFEANVTLRVQGISGPFIRAAHYHVREQNLFLAKEKFESQVRQDFAHMQYQSINFEYVKSITEI